MLTVIGLCGRINLVYQIRFLGIIEMRHFTLKNKKSPIIKNLQDFIFIYSYFYLLIFMIFG